MQLFCLLDLLVVRSQHNGTSDKVSYSVSCDLTVATPSGRFYTHWSVVE